MRRLLSRFRAMLPDKIDVHLYAGALLVAYGVSMYSRPAGLIAFGVALLTFVYWRPE